MVSLAGAMGAYWSSRLASTFGDGDKVEAVIYRVQCNITDKVYIGSTTCINLQRRLRQHEGHFRAWQQNKSAWYSVFEVLEGDDYFIEKLEDVKSLDREVVRTRERYYLDLFRQLAVNRRNPHRKKWEIKHQHASAMRSYYHKNKDRINDRNKASNSERARCDACKIWISKGGKARHERTNKHITNVLLNE